MMSSLQARLWVLVVGVNWGMVALAQPVIETMDRFELNWSTMKVRFYGEATADFSGKGFDGAEKSAVENGLFYVLGSVSKVRTEKGLSPGSKNLANELTKQAYVINTNYFGDGRVRADMECSLGKVLDVGSIEFFSEEPQSPTGSATAIAVAIRGLKNPKLLSEIYGEDGEVVHRVQDVSRIAFKKNGFGRWFYKNSSEARNYLGKESIALEGVFINGRLVVKKDEWQKIKAEHPRLIEESKLAFLLNSSNKGQVKESF